METLLATSRTLTNRVLNFCLGARLAPIRSPAPSSHRHWDRVVRAWR